MKVLFSATFAFVLMPVIVWGFIPKPKLFEDEVVSAENHKEVIKTSTFLPHNENGWNMDDGVTKEIHLDDRLKNNNDGSHREVSAIDLLAPLIVVTLCILLFHYCLHKRTSPEDREIIREKFRELSYHSAGPRTNTKKKPKTEETAKNSTDAPKPLEV